jgi:predicted metal-binding membrane protein
VDRGIRAQRCATCLRCDYRLAQLHVFNWSDSSGSLLWVALIAGFVFVEKLLPAHRLTSRFAGAAPLLCGLVLLA